MHINNCKGDFAQVPLSQTRVVLEWATLSTLGLVDSHFFDLFCGHSRLGRNNPRWTDVRQALAPDGSEHLSEAFCSPAHGTY